MITSNTRQMLLFDWLESCWALRGLLENGGFWCLPTLFGGMIPPHTSRRYVCICTLGLVHHSGPG